MGLDNQRWRGNPSLPFLRENLLIVYDLAGRLKNIMWRGENTQSWGISSLKTAPVARPPDRPEDRRPAPFGEAAWLL